MAAGSSVGEGPTDTTRPAGEAHACCAADEERSGQLEHRLQRQRSRRQPANGQERATLAAASVAPEQSGRGHEARARQRRDPRQHRYRPTRRRRPPSGCRGPDRRRMAATTGSSARRRWPRPVPRSAGRPASTSGLRSLSTRGGPASHHARSAASVPLQASSSTRARDSVTVTLLRSRASHAASTTTESADASKAGTRSPGPRSTTGGGGSRSAPRRRRSGRWAHQNGSEIVPAVRSR